MNFVLVHSPLVGPSTWRWVADALSMLGHEMVVPDLRTAAATAQPDAVISTAVGAIPTTWESVVVVGHSGAGSSLPSIATAAPTRTARMVFVDAGLLPCAGQMTQDSAFLQKLRSMAADGVLPRWSTWWGDGAMEVLVPDRDQRVAVEADMVEVPLAYFESAIDVPAGWCDLPSAYLLLSEPYRADSVQARTRGWPTIERIGNHLDIVNDADSVAASILELVRD